MKFACFLGRFIVLIALLQVQGCGSRPPSDMNLSTLTSSDPVKSDSGVNVAEADTPTGSDRDIIQPFVLFISSLHKCPGYHLGNISPLVDADVGYFTERLTLKASEAVDLGSLRPDIDGFHLENPTGDDIRTVLLKAAQHGLTDHGLVVVYTGHGVKDEKRSRSQLCLQDGAYDVIDIIRTANKVERELLPWLGLVLNACNSAYVDIREAAFPVSVISGSVEEIEVLVYTDNEEIQERCQMVSNAVANTEAYEARPTPFVQVTADALAAPNSDLHDRNRDGMLTLHELFHNIAQKASTAWRGCRVLRPEPRLMRISPSDIPIRFYETPTETVDTITAIIERLETSPERSPDRMLANALEAQLMLRKSKTLPTLRWDFVIQNAVGVFDRPDMVGLFPMSDEEMPMEQIACTPPGSDILYLTRKIDAPSQLALWKFATFSTFWQLREQGGMVDILLPLEDLLSDQNRVYGISPKSRLKRFVPKRNDCIGASALDSDAAVGSEEIAPFECRMVRSLSMPGVCETNWRDLESNLMFRVCDEEEGLCFKKE